MVEECYGLHVSQQACAPRSGGRKLARGTRCLGTPGIGKHNADRTLKGCRGVLAPLPGCDAYGQRFPGVRKKRVPLANFLARLRRAQPLGVHVCSQVALSARFESEEQRMSFAVHAKEYGIGPTRGNLGSKVVH